MFYISDEGVALIKRFEGLELHAYRDVAGILTIGYGHTGPDVFDGQVITEAEAERLLRQDVERFEQAVNEVVKVPIVQPMFDALVSLSFNIGASALKKSTAIKRLNQQDYEGAAEAITWWNKARINGTLQVVAGLARRRASEAALFLRDLDQIKDETPAGHGDVVENPPRRSNPITTRTTTGAAASGGAGAAGAGAVVMDNLNDLNKDKDEDSGESNGSGEASGETDTGDAPQTPPDTDAETEQPTGETTSETQADGGLLDDVMDDIEAKDYTDAIIVACGILAVLAAIYVIAARIDDWRNYRR